MDVPISRLRAWFLPDLALLASIVTLFYCLFLFDGGRKLFRDSDTGWHIRTGEAILSDRSLPKSDTYSFTRAGSPWFAWEWGAGVLMGLAHRWDGLRGVACLYMLLIAACTWVWFRLHWAAGGDFLLAGLMASPMISTVNLHWLARPHIFSWLLLLGAVWWAERPPQRFRWFHLPVCALVTALWANLHASFFLAPVIALVYAAAHTLRPVFWSLERDREHAHARWFLAAGAASLLGSLANPYGWNLHIHLVAYLRNRELLARVGEFQSFNFHVEGAAQILAVVGLACLGAVLALSQKKLGPFLLSVMLIAVALRSARGLPLVALLLLPLANGAITEALRRARDLRPAIRRLVDGWWGYTTNLRAIDKRLHGAASAVVVMVLLLGLVRLPAVADRVGFPPDEFPVKAASAVEALPADARILAPDKYGGYLIYRFAGQRKVFFDGRSDFYGVDYMKSYIRLVEVRPGWREQVAGRGFTHALLPVNYSLAGVLRDAGWRSLYQDAVTVLLEAP